MARRFAHKIDGNQNRILHLARRLGCSVVNMSALGDGVPDALLGYKGKNLLIEIKNPDGKDEIGPLQKAFIENWTGIGPFIIRTEEDLFRLLDVKVSPKKKQSICPECGEYPKDCNCAEQHRLERWAEENERLERLTRTTK